MNRNCVIVVTNKLLTAKIHTMEDIFYDYQSENMFHLINCLSQVPWTKTYRKRARFKVIFKSQILIKNNCVFQRTHNILLNHLFALHVILGENNNNDNNNNMIFFKHESFL